ncbi:hypothetical protein PV726_37785 [Streptomyces europaeiscabiei]|uniref:hypothetical protein n=2 Tax=Streptomyces TaxID=1883 RepID=UPI0029AF05FE|nr:hypothetical protein [Streptomyces europaeiscabiei]MDX3695971.1 hypothetical protein [Streptomyces europaeiscabiei]
MGSDLVLSDPDQPEGRRGLARPTRQQRAMQRRAEVDLASLVQRGRHEEVRAMLRRRMTDDALSDVQEVGKLAQELADDDPFIASLLIPVVQEFTRATAQDIREFGRGRDA